MRDPVNCPVCGKFLKWHSEGDPDSEDYREHYTCSKGCPIECFDSRPGYVTIREIPSWRLQRSNKSSDKDE